jgi:hypothetical protein
MVYVVIAAVMVAALVAAVVLRGRPRGTDLDSVRSYHSALGTLEHLSDRDAPTSMRVVNAPGQADGPHVAPIPGRAAGSEGEGPRDRSEVPPVPVRGNDEFPDPETPLVFDDARPRDRYRSGPAAGAPAHRVDRAQLHALESMNHRPRRGWYTVATVVALVVLAALAYAGSKRPTATKHAGRSTTATTGARATGGTSPSSRVHTGHPGTAVRAPKSTSTTLPSTLVAASATATSATYSVPFNSFQLTVTTTAPCWVQATTQASGSIQWAGTVQPGAKQEIQVTGATSVELGNPSATLVVGKIPVVLPTPLHTPFVATFQPAAASVGTAGSTTTTSSPTTG